MKIFLLLFLATGLASTEKLDRTYLPPPGSKFSGGSPGDIQVPLEFPKETYLTGHSRPQDIPELELGINPRPKPIDSAQSSTQKPGRFTYFQNSYPVPKTTTSYAITQTTTFAPAEDYEALNHPSGFLNATGQSKYPQGQTYQEQPYRGLPGNVPSYNQYQQGNQQSTLVPYGSTTQRPRFESNRKPVPYLPPVFGQEPSSRNNLGYPFGQPQGQHGQQHSSTYGPVINQPDFTSPQAKQQNQFVGNINVPSSTTAPQYQDRRYGPTTRPDVNQQRFGSSTPTQQNLSQLPGGQNFPTSTSGPEYQDDIRLTTPGSAGQSQFVQNQNFPSSTAAPQYQDGQRDETTGSNLQNQYISSTTSPRYQDNQNVIRPGSGQQRFQQNQNNYPGKQNFPTSTAARQYQNGQQLFTPGSTGQNQYLENQNIPSTSSPHYQDGQRYSKPGSLQETVAPNQQVFGSRIPNRKNQNQYPGNQNFPSSATPQLENGQQFTAPGSEQPSQYFGNQNIPSTAFPQYQDNQRIFRPGAPQEAPNQQVFGSRVPSQLNQNQGNRNFPSFTATPQFTDSTQFTTPGSIQQPLAPNQQIQYQSQGHQINPSSTAAPQYQHSTPGSVQSQYINQNIPATGSPQFQNGKQYNTPGAQEQFLNQQSSGSQSGNEQYPSTVAPQYQSTFAPTPGSNQQGLKGVNQRFPSSTTSPQFITESQSQYGNNGIQSVPGTLPSSQPGIGSKEYEFTGSSPNYNQVTSSTTAGSFPTRGYPTPVSGVVSQGRPERPQAASDRTAEIISYENVLSPEGYSYSYDTSNGIHADETGIVGDGTRAQGGYSYTGDDGKVYSVFYSADENGFKPIGDHLPTPPPIPEPIQRVIEQAIKDKESGISDDGSYKEEQYGHMKYDGIFKPKNKMVSPINGANILNRYENRFVAQKSKQFVPKIGKEVNKEENSVEDINEQEQVEDEKLSDDNIEEKEENNKRISNKRPTKVKNLTIKDKTTKSINRNKLNRRPVSDTNNQEDMEEEEEEEDEVEETTDDVLITDISDGNEDLEDLNDKSDVVNYKDDPNSRTDFRGTNKYLPKPKKVNKFNQSDKRRPSVLPEGTEQPTKESSKPGKPSDRRTQASKKTMYRDEQDFIDEHPVRNPSKENKVAQKNRNQSKFQQPDASDYTENNEGYTSDDESKLKESNKPGVYQHENKRTSKPTSPKNADENKNIKTVIDKETGYEYTPPQRKFNSEGAVEFPTRTSVTEKIKQMTQKGSQTTRRPFMTPNVYDDDEELTDEDTVKFDNHVKPLRPLRPSPTQKSKYPGSGKQNNSYDDNSEIPKSGRFDSTRQPTGTTSARRPFARPQTASIPEYEERDIIGQNEYNKPIRTQNTRRPGNKVKNNNTPNKGVSKVESDVFVSTTPLPHTETNSNNKYQFPGQHQTGNKPTDGSSFYEEIAPGEYSIVRQPATNNGSRIPNSQGQIPSTTYKPSYTFGDRTLAPSDSITVDGFGRPISTTSVPVISGEISKNQPEHVDDKFRPSVGRFGVTSAPTQRPGVYQGSTSTPIGEDFSGPKHPQGFDPETGYYYK